MPHELCSLCCGDFAAAEEHLLRLKAEADAQDKAQRLQVAQEQLAEYALEKSRAAEDILQQAQAIEQALQVVTSIPQAAGLPVEMLQQVQQLKQKLAEAALEAQAFSEQQQADVERLKRSSQQVRLLCCGYDPS